MIENVPHIFVFVQFTRCGFWVGPVLNKSKWLFLLMQNWTTACLRQRGSKPEVSEDVGMFHKLRMWMSCFSLPQYFAHSLS